MNEILDLIQEIENIMNDLLLSGFNTIHDYTLNEMKKLGQLCESYGMIYASNIINNLVSDLSKKRHNFEFNYSTVIEDYFKLNKYLILCRKRIEIEELNKNFR